MRVIFRKWKSHASYELKRKRIDSIIIVLLIATILGLMLRYFEKGVVPKILSMAEDQAETGVVVLIDKSIMDCKELENLQYEDIIQVSRGADNAITSVSAKTVKLNRIRSELSVEMNNRLDAMSETTVYVPIGTLLGFRLLSGAGPRIPISVEPYGTAYAHFASSFESAEINRTIHRVSIEASANIRFLVPFGTYSLDVKTEVPIAETVLTGEVPKSYININGLVSHGKANK